MPLSLSSNISFFHGTYTQTIQVQYKYVHRFKAYKKISILGPLNVFSMFGAHFIIFSFQSRLLRNEMQKLIRTPKRATTGLNQNDNYNSVKDSFVIIKNLGGLLVITKNIRK